MRYYLVVFFLLRRLTKYLDLNDVLLMETWHRTFDKLSPRSLSYGKLSDVFVNVLLMARWQADHLFKAGPE